MFLSVVVKLECNVVNKKTSNFLIYTIKRDSLSLNLTDTVCVCMVCVCACLCDCEWVF